MDKLTSKRYFALKNVLIENVKKRNSDIALISEKIISLWKNQQTSFQQYNQNIEKLNRILPELRLSSFAKSLSVSLIKLRNTRLQSDVQSLLKKLPALVQENDLRLIESKNRVKIGLLFTYYNPLKISLLQLTPAQKEACSKVIAILFKMQDILERESLTNVQTLFFYGALITLFPYALIVTALRIVKSAIDRLVQWMIPLKEASLGKISHLEQRFWPENTTLTQDARCLEDLKLWGNEAQAEAQDDYEYRSPGMGRY